MLSHREGFVVVQNPVSKTRFFKNIFHKWNISNIMMPGRLSGCMCVLSKLVSISTNN